jgi:hypothetical protein
MIAVIDWRKYVHHFLKIWEQKQKVVLWYDFVNILENFQVILFEQNTYRIFFSNLFNESRSLATNTRNNS